MKKFAVLCILLGSSIYGMHPEDASRLFLPAIIKDSKVLKKCFSSANLGDDKETDHHCKAINAMLYCALMSKQTDHGTQSICNDSDHQAEREVSGEKYWPLNNSVKHVCKRMGLDTNETIGEINTMIKLYEDLKIVNHK